MIRWCFVQQDNVKRVCYVQVNGKTIESNELEIYTCVISEKLKGYISNKLITLSDSIRYLPNWRGRKIRGEDGMEWYRSHHVPSIF